MELIIILLISVEVVIVSLASFETVVRSSLAFKCLIRDGPELWNMAFGENHPETKPDEKPRV